MSRKAPGQCFHCGCMEENACQLTRYIRCSWVYVNPRRVCSNRECVQKEIDLLFAEIEEKRRKVGEALCP